jgi:hypothetical protein
MKADGSTRDDDAERADTDVPADMILRPADLRAGDILLYRPKGSGKVSSRISAATGSPYTHASIYVGNGQVAESNFPLGVRLTEVEKSIAGSVCVAVMRNQMGFGTARETRLKGFVDSVVKRGRFYDLQGVTDFEASSADFFARQLDIIREDYGKVASNDDLAKERFFCSAFVVACYAAVGIIGDTAQVAYRPDAFSPGHLHREPAFGRLLGYLVPRGGFVPEGDPLMIHSTRWRDCLEAKWW